MSQKQTRNKEEYYLPESISKSLLKGTKAVSRSQRLKGAILFFDLVKFTSLTRELSESGSRGAEDLHDLMTRYYTTTIDIINRFGGSVYQFAGDSAVAAFEGANKKDIANSAVSCALEIQSALLKEPIKYKERSLETKYSISYGNFQRILLGDAQSYFQAALIGNAVEEAVKMESLASGGDILITSEVAKILGDNALTEKSHTRYKILELKKNTKAPEVINENITPENPSLYLKQCSKFIPPSILEKIRTDQMGFIGEFRDVTTAFLQLNLSEASLSEAGDSIDITNLNSFYLHIRQLAETFGGTLIQTDISDKGYVFLLLFGAPRALEKKENMAVRFAAKAKEAISEYSFIENLNIGIATGPLYCGDVGSKTRKGYSVLGESVNLASRLMAHSGDFICAIDDKTLNSLESSFSYTTRTNIELKGIHDGAAVHNITGELAAKTPEKQKSSLVGRKKELALLKKKLHESIQNGSSIGLIGEAGIGKSRLVDDFITEAASAEIDVLTGVCYSYEKFTAYFPWKLIFSALFELNSETDHPTAIKKIESQLTPVQEDKKSWSKVFARLLGENIKEDALTAKMEPRQKSLRIFEITAQVLKEKASREPLLLLFEDYHWIDESSENLIEFIINLQIPGLAVFIVSRPEGPASNLKGRPGHYELQLGELEEQDALHYLRLKMNLAETGDRVHDLESEILHRAHGNPFFLESIVYSLQDSGVLKTTKGKKNSLTDENQKIEIPDSLQGVLLSRIDRLSETEKLVLKNAAVIGRLFHYELLKELTPDEITTSLPSHLESLENNDFTLLETDSPLSYLFKHILIRDVAYNSLLTATKQALHNKIADHLESLGEDTIIENIDHLAYHYLEGNNIEKSIQYSQMAAREAVKQYSNADAIHHYTNIIKLLEKTGSDKDTLYDTKIELGHVYRSSGSHAEAVDTFQEPLSMVKDKLKLSRVHAGLGQVYQEQGKVDLAIEELEKSLQMTGINVPQSDTAVKLKILGLLLKRVFHAIAPFLFFKASLKKEQKILMQYDIMQFLAKIYFFANVEKVAWANLSQVNLTEKLKKHDAIKGKAHASLALIYEALGLSSLTDKNMKIALSYTEKSEDPYSMAILLQRGSSIEMYRNNPEEMEKKLKEAAVIYEKLGESWEKSLTLGLLVIAGILDGNYKMALQYNKDSLEFATSENIKQIQGWALSSEGYLSFVLGLQAPQTCLKTMTEAQEIHLSANDQAAYLANLRYMLTLHIRNHDTQEIISNAKILFEGLNKYDTIIPHAHAGYFEIIEGLFLASTPESTMNKERLSICKKALKKLKAIGKKFSYLYHYALLGEALFLFHSGHTRQAALKIEKAVETLEKSPNLLETTIAYYYGALIDTPGQAAYMQKGRELAEKNQFTWELKRLNELPSK